MQCENLYNLQSTAYIIYALFAFKIDKILGDQLLALQTRSLIGAQTIHFFYFVN